MVGKLDEMLEGILAMDWCPIQGDWDKLWLDGALTCSYITDFAFEVKKKKPYSLQVTHRVNQSVGISQSLPLLIWPISLKQTNTEQSIGLFFGPSVC